MHFKCINTTVFSLLQLVFTEQCVHCESYVFLKLPFIIINPEVVLQCKEQIHFKILNCNHVHLTISCVRILYRFSNTIYIIYTSLINKSKHTTHIHIYVLLVLYVLLYCDTLHVTLLTAFTVKMFKWKINIVIPQHVFVFFSSFSLLFSLS